MITETELEHGAEPYHPMCVTVEVWPVAADELGLWLVSGEEGPWPSSPIPRHSEPHAMAVLELGRHGVLPEVVLLHSTSWRAEGNAVVLTYLAVLRLPSLVRLASPDARPISPLTAEVVGGAPTHGPTDPPAPRYWDVLLHGIRHLKYLLETDATVALSLREPWREHLEGFQPAIARMYEAPHQG
jgi:hypothetical protein